MLRAVCLLALATLQALVAAEAEVDTQRVFLKLPPGALGASDVQGLLDGILAAALGAADAAPHARVVENALLSSLLRTFVVVDVCPLAKALLEKHFTLVPDKRWRVDPLEDASAAGGGGSGSGRQLQGVAACPPRSSWGLSRIQARALLAEPPPSVGPFTASAPCVDTYIVDSGIARNHPDFVDGPTVEAGRNFNYHGDPSEGIDPEDTSDCNGHGTHVSSTVAGAVSGIASRAHIVPVRVLDCGGWTATSTLIEALGWVVTRKAERGTPGVINMSLGGGRDPGPDPMEEALAGVVAAGLLPVVAAGNSFTDACDASPAWLPTAFTVGASNSSDGLACFGGAGCVPGRGSNFGSCVDAWAPGESICGAALAGGYRLLSGTSMAAPHVTGVAAQLLEAVPGASPDALRAALLAAATAGVLDLHAIPDIAEPETPNVLLFTPEAGFGASQCALVSPAPSATASASPPATLTPGLKSPLPSASSSAAVVASVSEVASAGATPAPEEGVSSAPPPAKPAPAGEEPAPGPAPAPALEAAGAALRAGRL